MLCDYFGGNFWRSDFLRIRSGFLTRTHTDPGFVRVNPVRSSPGFVNPIRSGPAFVNTQLSVQRAIRTADNDLTRMAFHPASYTCLPAYSRSLKKKLGGFNL